MSITDELRKEARGLGCYMYIATQAEQLIAIADRIDVEHERAMSRAGQLLADAEKERDYNYANWQECKQKVLQHNITMDELSTEIERLKDELSHRIELPKDADNVPINAGDVLDGYGKTIEVVELRYGRSGWVLISRDGNGYADTFAFTHHAPTVEDVLREFSEKMNENLGMYTGEAIDADEWRDADAKTIAEYAAKLRLAEEDA